jgi:hypothetical protein
MKRFDKGVSYYTRGKLPVSFPEDDVCCYRCPCMGIESKSDREYCRRTGEYLPAPRDIIGFNCPIDFTIDFKEDSDG